MSRNIRLIAFLLPGSIPANPSTELNFFAFIEALDFCVGRAIWNIDAVDNAQCISMFQIGDWRLRIADPPVTWTCLRQRSHALKPSELARLSLIPPTIKKARPPSARGAGRHSQNPIFN